MAKKKVKNLYVRKVLGSCGCGNGPRSKVQSYSIGEYLNGKWHTTGWVCEKCFEALGANIDIFFVRAPDYGSVKFVSYQGTHIPDFLTSLEDKVNGRTVL
jgi:hypothetical protein